MAFNAQFVPNWSFSPTSTFLLALEAGGITSRDCHVLFGLDIRPDAGLMMWWPQGTNKDALGSANSDTHRPRTPRQPLRLSRLG